MSNLQVKVHLQGKNSLKAELSREKTTQRKQTQEIKIEKNIYIATVGERSGNNDKNKNKKRDEDRRRTGQRKLRKRG